MSFRDDFHRLGYAVVEDALRPGTVEALRGEIARTVDETLRDLALGEPLETRLARAAELDPDAAKRAIAALEGARGGGWTGRAMYDLLLDDRLLDLVEQLTGPEIVGSSVYRIRPKLPRSVRGEVPWHQDSGYFDARCDGELIVTVWIPLVDATVENGCLEVLPNAHRSGVVPHRAGGHGGFLEILDHDLPAGEAVPVPVPRGGALFMTNLTPHRSTPNLSNGVRWSCDVRYQSATVPTNVGLTPSESVANGPIACYAPEGDFVVRSSQGATSYEEFVRMRAAYEVAGLPGPDRGWSAMMG